MSYQNPATFAPYSPPPDETKSFRNSTRYIPPSSSSRSQGGSAAASTSASAAKPTASANPFAGVYQNSGQIPPNQIKINTYETDLPLRVDIAASLTYLFGCITGVLFLILEQKNDYVRFHAWQSSIVFGILFFFHFIIIFISSFLSWVLFLIEIGLIGFLSYQAYVNAPTLHRYEVPFFGPVASLWVDNE
ncbi:hypothetical protein G9A89_002442 [Geosiphon pyriformis]|nr:hypothetical protein G9A89_002442 [Geosiphon pyriformis]